MASEDEGHNCATLSAKGFEWCGEDALWDVYGKVGRDYLKGFECNLITSFKRGA